MKVRVFYKPDKTVMIMRGNLNYKLSDETEDECLKRIFDRDTKRSGFLISYPYVDIDDSELPSNYEARNFWEGEKSIGVFVNEEKLLLEEQKKSLVQKVQAELVLMAMERLG